MTRLVQIFVISGLLLVAACKNANGTEEKLKDASTSLELSKSQVVVVKSISPEMLENKMSANEDIQLIDVRTDREWSQGHLIGAQHFEINNPNWEKQTQTLDKSKPVYLYCAKGGRSARSAKLLEKAGFAEIYDLKGGITNWKNQGKPLEK